ncbi:MAG: VWA domain-containing protein, partial [Phycisphaerales bacterium]
LIRPWWLLALIPAILVIWLLWRQDSAARRLSGIISSHLLEHLLISPQGRSRIRPVHLLGIVLALMVAALAGPAWHREPLPFTEDEAPLILALDLSESMDSEDIKPSRLQRAKQKIRDLLALRAGARTGMIAYAGSAHTVLPLTDDPNVLETYLDALSTSVMPASGKDASKALRLAHEMLVKETAAGTILFMTDGIETQHVPDFVERASTSKHALATLIVSPYAHESDESSDTASLKALSKQANMRTTVLTVDDTDVRRVNAGIQSHMRHVQDQDNNQRWRDAGYWLVLPIVALACVWFRRGWSVRWAAAAILLIMFYQPHTACAGGFRFANLWLTPDQQGRQCFDRGDYLKAAERFEDPLWKGTAYYAAGQFDDAIIQFTRAKTAEGFFNLGNAHAHKGDYPAALTSYEKAVSLKKDYPDAKFNLEYIQLLIPKPEEQEEGPPGDPSFDPDEIKFDEKGKKGKEGEIEQAQLTDEQITELWMRRIQTSPAQFLRLKFSYQSQIESTEKN